ncbi:inactive pancreatic lipase-related protein 1-like [Mytilus californianus]|uniref:inactive pancreatic lipase-related protein 1-like n=1 Tax=Mytilus californianus TaxID=6549 RepID=UPI0022452A7A|nr:inactive pancreatic lipase-related protein 1-like [Mytilus californianus]
MKVVRKQFRDNSSHVCYDHIGCFSNSAPFLNAFGYLPLSPDHINTSFHLYTQFDVNVIVVIWTRGAYDNYIQAVANTRVVGAVTANLVKLLHDAGGVSYDDVHIVGHSLGAHVAGYVGQRVPIGRITGLDPAGPESNTADQRVRLDPSDATFVDIIHTDGALGFRHTMGHVDFYPNGGKVQPGCLFDKIAPFYSCGHMRSVYYFIESINTNCHFSSHPCDSEDDYKNLLCTGCGIGCQEMGYHISRNARGTFYLKTSPNSLSRSVGDLMDEANRLYSDLLNNYNKMIRPIHDIKESTKETFALVSNVDVGSMFSVLFTINRNPLFYLVNIMFPIILLTFLNSFVFLLPATSGERISFSITVLLAIAVFMTMISSHLPKTSRTMSRLCYFLVSNLIFSCIICLLTIIQLRLFHTCDTRSVPTFLRRLVIMCNSQKHREYFPNGQDKLQNGGDTSDNEATRTDNSFQYTSKI